MKKILVLNILLLLQFVGFSQLKYVNSVAGSEVGECTVSHNGKYLLMGQSHEITLFEISNTTGGLTKKKSLLNPDNEDFTYLNLSPDDKFLYTRSHYKKNAKLVSVFRVYSLNLTSSEFKLIQSIDNQDNEEFDFNSDVIISPKGTFVFVNSENGNKLYVYKRDPSSGKLSFASKSIANQSNFAEFEMSNDERFLYSSSYNLFKALAVYQMDKSTGTLNEIQQFVHPSYRDYNSSKFVITPNGKFIYTIGTDVYSTSQDQTQITILNRDANTGLVSYKSHYANLKNDGIRNISFIHMDGSGETFFALSSLGNEVHAVYVFKANPIDGSLTKIQTFIDGGLTSKLRGVYDMAFSNSNRFVYLTAARDNAITILDNPQAKKSIAPVEEVQIVENTTIEVEQEPNNITNVQVQQTTTNTPTATINSSNSRAISKELYSEVWKKLMIETSDAKRMDICFEQLEGKSMKTVQIAAMAMLFTSEYKRLEFVKFMSFFTSDKENYKILVDLFTFDTIKDDFNKSIK